MTRSKQLLSAFSENYFFKELIFDNLLYTPTNASEIELADLVINLEDYIIAIQLKERNTDDQTSDVDKENAWLEKKCKVAKKQIKKTIQLISSGTIPVLQNKRGQMISLRADAEIVPLIVFENSKISSYPHLLRRHSPDGDDINCMSFDDYVEMCRTLISPIEIIYYLEYRKRMFTENGNTNCLILNMVGDEIVIATPTQKESLTHVFLAETYGYQEAKNCTESMQFFRSFLHKFPDRISYDTSYGESYNILLFFAHMNRIEISKIWNMLNDTKQESYKRNVGICHSLRSTDSKYVILFIAGEIIPMDLILPIVLQKSPETKQILEISIYWNNTKQFNIDFLYWNHKLFANS